MNFSEEGIRKILNFIQNPLFCLEFESKSGFDTFYADFYIIENENEIDEAIKYLMLWSKNILRKLRPKYSKYSEISTQVIYKDKFCDSYITLALKIGIREKTKQENHDASQERKV